MLSAAAAAVAEFAHHLSVHRTAAVATTVSSSQQQQQQMRTDAARPPLVMRRSFTFARLQQTRAGEGRVGGSWRAEMRGSTVFRSAGGRSSINKGAMVAIGNENVPKIIHTRTHTRARV